MRMSHLLVLLEGQQPVAKEPCDRDGNSKSSSSQIDYTPYSARSSEWAKAYKSLLTKAISDGPARPSDLIVTN